VELKTDTLRRFSECLAGVNEDLIQLLNVDYGIDADEFSPVFPKLLSKVGNEFSAKEFRKLWSYIELAEFHKNWLAVSFYPKNKITIASIKSHLNKNGFSATEFSVLTINKSPKILAIILYPGKVRQTLSKASVHYSLRDTIYILPDSGILLSSVNSDEIGKKFQSSVSELFNKLEAKRVKTLNISKFYNDTMMINKLTVNAVFQITGFDGFDEINFVGPHVKKGLYGLNKRQDIRVNLDGIGPRVAVSGENIDLKIGPNVRIKNFDGIEELLQLF